MSVDGDCTIVQESQEESRPKPECGRYLRSIYFYITEGCNLKCRHCWINPPFEKNSKKPQYPFVSFALFKKIVDQAIELGLAGLKLTGGEPLMHPDIEKLIDYVIEKDLRLTIETNGISVTPELAAKIKAAKNSFISVSLDSPDPDIHEWVRGVPGCYHDALRGAGYLVDAGFKPQIIMSLMRRNAHQVEELVRLAESIGAGSVKFNLVTPTARGEKLHEKDETLSIEERVELGRFVENDLAKRSSIRLIYSNPPAFNSFSRLKQRKNLSGCGILNIIGVLGTGKYALCGIGESVPELVFGDAEVNSLADVWNKNKVLNEIREGLPSKLKGICRDCIFFKECRGSCIANNYYAYRDLFAPHQYCANAYDAGFFPRSRLVPGSEYDRNWSGVYAKG